MINAIEKFADIAFERPTRHREIATHLAREHLQSINSRVRPLPDTTGIGVKNKGTFKDWSEDAIDSVMNDAVSYICLMNHAVFRIEDLKTMIRSVSVGFCLELPMQAEDLIFKVMLKGLNIFTRTFTRLELIPGREEIW